MTELLEIKIGIFDYSSFSFFSVFFLAIFGSVYVSFSKIRSNFGAPTAYQQMGKEDDMQFTIAKFVYFFFFTLCWHLCSVQYNTHLQVKIKINETNKWDYQNAYLAAENDKWGKKRKV